MSKARHPSSPVMPNVGSEDAKVLIVVRVMVLSIPKASASVTPVLDEGRADVRLDESSTPDPPAFVVL